MKRWELVSFRVKRETRLLLEEVCDARGEDVSSFVRRAVFKELAGLGYLPEKQKKALGLKAETQQCTSPRL